VEATVTPSMRVGDVTWTSGLNASGAPSDSLESFPRNAESIVVALEVEHVPAGESFTAAWSLDGTPIEGIASNATVEGASDSAWVAFTLDWNGEVLWPVGELGVTITSSSGESTSGTIFIDPV